MFNYVEASPTIIGCDFFDNDAQHGAVVFNYANSSPTLIDCTFEGNTASGAGGAMVNLESEVSLNGCTFRGNGSDLGGAMYSYYRSNQTMTNCRFENNTAPRGGAIYDDIESQSNLDQCVFIGNTAQNDGGAIGNGFDGTETLKRCAFIANTAKGRGGAVFQSLSLFPDSAMRMIDCTFEANKAVTGGAIYTDTFYGPSISACTFNSNTAVENGGGIYYEYSSLELHDCRFAQNQAKNGARIASVGGEANITNTTFEDNIATGWGGGIYASSSTSYPPTELLECTFLRNQAIYGGGYYHEAGPLRLSRSRFSQNSADQGGGLRFNGGGEISQCTFDRNTASSSGGGILMFNDDVPLTLADCAFLGNTAGVGGGISNYGNPLITNCMFSHNNAGFGGGMHQGWGAAPVKTCSFLGNRAYEGGGLLVEDEGNATISDCLLSGNSAELGAALGNYGDLALDHCTLSSNEASDAGGGVYSWYKSSVAVANCILWGDSPEEIAGVGFAGTVLFSDVHGEIPPLFVRIPFDGGDGWGDDPATPDLDEGFNDDFGDLRLQPGSPCINAGNPNFVPQPGETDLDGHARILCGRLDMGAYEAGIGDFDCDNNVDIADFSYWSNCMISPLTTGKPTLDGGCEALDFDADGDVDLRDFGQFLLIVTP